MAASRPFLVALLLKAARAGDYDNLRGQEKGDYNIANLITNRPTIGGPGLRLALGKGDSAIIIVGALFA